MTVENNKNQNANKFPSTSSLSRNYSGSVAYFTPTELVNCILNGIDFFLLNKFKNSSGLIGDDLEFIEPAAGLMTFPLNLVEYVRKRASTENFDSWILNTLLKKLHAFEINPEIYRSAKKIWENKKAFVKPYREVKRATTLKYSIYD